MKFNTFLIFMPILTSVQASPILTNLWNLFYPHTTSSSSVVHHNCTTNNKTYNCNHKQSMCSLHSQNKTISLNFNTTCGKLWYCSPDNNQVTITNTVTRLESTTLYNTMTATQILTETTTGTSTETTTQFLTETTTQFDTVTSTETTTQFDTVTSTILLTTTVYPTTNNRDIILPTFTSTPTPTDIPCDICDIVLPCDEETTTTSTQDSITTDNRDIVFSTQIPTSTPEIPCIECECIECVEEVTTQDTLTTDNRDIVIPTFTPTSSPDVPCELCDEPCQEISTDCTWIGHCLGDTCSTNDDCNGSWVCDSGVCSVDKNLVFVDQMSTPTDTPIDTPTPTPTDSTVDTPTPTDSTVDTSVPTDSTVDTSVPTDSTVDTSVPTDSASDCTWIGHCLGDTCSTNDDCDGSWICTSGICSA